MLDYIKKFNNLSKELRDKVSAPAVMSAIEKLEKKYNVNLATVVMKIMVKEADANKLADYFIQEFKLDKTKAEQLAKELKEQILSGAADYLGIKKEVRSPPSLKLRRTSKKKLPSVANALAGEEVRSDKTEEIAAHQTAIAQSVKESNFLFLDEDEAEIKEMAKQMDTRAETVLSDNEIEKQLDKILAQAQINFGSEELAVRFRKILKIYLRGIRDRIDTKQTLIKPMDVGGLGFDQESAEQILKITDSNKASKSPDIAQPEKIKTLKPEQERQASLKEAGLASPASLSQSGVRDIDYDLISLANKKIATTKKDIKEKTTDKAIDKHKSASPVKQGRLAPPPPSLSVNKAEIRKASPLFASPQEEKSERTSSVMLKKEEGPLIKELKPLLETEEPTKIKPAQEVKQIDDRKVDKTTGKIKMEDVKAKFVSPQGSGAGFRPKVMGPIDELKYMDLISFRRLDQDLVKIVEKIKGKISLLEEEDYAKRLKGIKAWRTSPVNKLYLEMGQASIGASKPIDIIIEERKATGKEFLSSEEFEAVTDLNRDLRF